MRETFKTIAAAALIGALVMTGCGQNPAGAGSSGTGTGSSGAGNGSSATATSAAAVNSNAILQPIIVTNGDSLKESGSGKFLLTTDYDTLKLDDASAAKYPELSAGLKAFSDKVISTQKKILEEGKKDIDPKEIDEGHYYSDKTAISIVRCDDILSFISANDTFYGGPHPNHACKGTTFDVKTGKELALSDVIKSEKDMLPLIEKALKKDYPDVAFDGKLDESLAKYFADEKNRSNWCITPDAIRFIFNPYDLAPYAFGEQVVDITFAENTALFTDKVKASSGAFVTPVGDLKRWPVDLNRDGKIVPVSVSVISENKDDPVNIGVTVECGDKSFSLKDQYFYGYKAKLVHTADKKNYLYFNTKSENDYQEIRVFELGTDDVKYVGCIEGSESAVYTKTVDDESASGDNTYVIEETPFVNPEGFYLDNRVDALSTYSIKRLYSTGADGMPSTKEAFGEATYKHTLILKQDYTAKGVDINTYELKGDVSLKKGDKIEIFKTNGKDTVIFKKGEEYIGIKYDGMNVDGKPAEDLFEQLFYAG